MNKISGIPSLNDSRASHASHASRVSDEMILGKSGTDINDDSVVANFIFLFTVVLPVIG